MELVETLLEYIICKSMGELLDLEKEEDPEEDLLEVEDDEESKS